MGPDWPGYALDALGAGHTLRAHWPGGTGRAGNSGNASGTLGAYVALRACRADRAGISDWPDWTHVTFGPLAAGIALRADIASDTLDALDALRARVAPGALGASGTRVSGRPHGAGISSGASCARFAGDALRAHGSLLAPVAFWSGTAGIPFHALRPLRALIPFGPRRAPFTAGVAALVVAVILPAVT